MGASPSRRALLKVSRSKVPYSPPFRDPLPCNPLVFLDIQVGKGRSSVYLGRIILELRKDIVPSTVEYFLQLDASSIEFSMESCLRQDKTGPLQEVDDELDFWQEPPLIELEDRNFDLAHMNGVISMDPATSHFSFCGTNIPALDGHHIVFGQIVDGYGILKAILQCGALTGKPKTEVSIIDCGRLDMNEFIGYDLLEPLSPRRQPTREKSRLLKRVRVRPVAIAVVVLCATWIARRPVRRLRQIGGVVRDLLTLKVKTNVRINLALD